MGGVSRSFQVFVKPAGDACNLACRYCYYLGKGRSGPEAGPARMSEELLESYIAQHIAASPDEIVRFSWHGGEPTLLGLAYFRSSVIEALGDYRIAAAVPKLTEIAQVDGPLQDDAVTALGKIGDEGVAGHAGHVAGEGAQAEPARDGRGHLPAGQ